MLCHPEFISFIESHKGEFIPDELIIQLTDCESYDTPYVRADDLEIKWIPEGSKFNIYSIGEWEVFELYDENKEWLVA